MKVLKRTVVLVLLVLISSAVIVPAFAGIDDTWDWKGKVRKLKVHVKAADADKEFGGKKLKDLVKDAMDNWNKHKADTGWEFEEGTAADHHIEVQTGGSGNGGAHTSGFGGKDKNREISKLTVVMDPNYSKGWGFNDDAKKNPLGTLKHELSHCLRLDHQGGTRSNTKKIKDPQGDETAGDDVTDISASDKEEAKKAATALIKTASAPVNAGTGATLSVRGFPDELPFTVNTEMLQLSLTANTFQVPAEVTLSATSFVSMPDPLNTPAGIERMVRGAHITVDWLGSAPSFFDVFVELQIPFEDGNEGEGWLIDLNDPKWTPIIEPTLRPFIYHEQARLWKDLSLFGGNFSLDTINDVLIARFPAHLLGMFCDPSDPNGTRLFLSVSGTPIPDASTLALFSVGLLGIARAMRRSHGRR